MKKTFVLAVASALSLTLAAHAEDKSDAPKADSGKDYIMLKVNGEDVKRSEVQDAWKAIFSDREAPPLDSFGGKMEDKFLREVASEYALYAEAQKEGVADSPEVKQMMDKLHRQVVIQELLKQKTKEAVSDDKLKALYDAHLKDTSGETPDHDELHARHILVKTKEDADAIEARLKKGEAFEKLAKEKSVDKSSGAEGGDLGWFTGDKMLPDFTKAVLKLKKGEVSQPVKTDFGWHVIRLEDRRKMTPPPFAEVKGTLKQEAGSKAVAEYVKGMMTNVKITKLDAEGHESSIPSLPAEKDKDLSASPAAGKDAPDQ